MAGARGRHLSGLRWTILLILLLTFIPQTAFSYVYLSPLRPKLVPAEGLTQEFHLTSEAPVFSDKDTFEDGVYSDYSDDEVFSLLVQRAMNYWNDVPQLSIQLKVGSERKGVINPDDNLFSVGIATISSVASGLAYPVPDENDSRRLQDCDIQVGTDIDSIPSFIFVLVHEFGHCLGLGHNHSDPDAIMGYWQPRNEVALGLDDVAGVLSLYPPISGEKIQPFAPCGSLAGRTGAAGKFFHEKKDNPAAFLPEEQEIRLGAWIILLLPLCVLSQRMVTSWSFRRRRQQSVR
jgi:hypothetical protein